MPNSLRRSPLLVALVVACAATGATGDGFAAQSHSTVVIPDDPEPPYEIEMLQGPLLERGSLSEDDWVSAWGAGVERLPDGGFLFWDATTPSRILAVSPNGADRRWIGREGEGPGEYRFVRWVRQREGLVHVFDLINNRRTVLDGRSFDAKQLRERDQTYRA